MSRATPGCTGVRCNDLQVRILAPHFRKFPIFGPARAARADENTVAACGPGPPSPARGHIGRACVTGPLQGGKGGDRLEKVRFRFMTPRRTCNFPDINRKEILSPRYRQMGPTRFALLLCVFRSLGVDTYLAYTPLSAANQYRLIKLSSTNSVALAMHRLRISSNRKSWPRRYIAARLSSISQTNVNLPLDELSHKLSKFEAISVDYFRRAAKGQDLQDCA